jgi:ribonuclease HI
MTSFPPKSSGKLFADPESPAPAEGWFVISVDGAARGNPGPAAYGVVVQSPDGKLLESFGKYIGRLTNNVAEYYALIAALDYAASKGIHKLRVRSDSQLIVNQMKGLYKVKHAVLRPLHERAKKQAAALGGFTIQYVPREQNREADAAANAALDRTSGSNREGAVDAVQRPASPSPSQARSAISTSRKIRARFREGVLVPEEPLGYGENEELEITIDRIPRR